MKYGITPQTLTSNTASHAVRWLPAVAFALAACGSVQAEGRHLRVAGEILNTLQTGRLLCERLLEADSDDRGALHALARGSTRCERRSKS